MYEKLHSYVTKFNENDEEMVVQMVPNANAEAFLAEQIPLLDCPDAELEEIYYFRWWTYRKHLKETEKGHIITEFLPEVCWGGTYNSINCPSGFHIREGRWLKDPEGWLREYINFWLDGHGLAYDYSSWYAYAVLEYCTIKNDFGFATNLLPKLVAYFETRQELNERPGNISWSDDDKDGMEFSISGPGLRPTITAYAYADAFAIAEIAGMAGDFALERKFRRKAEDIKKAADTLLWDKDFYKTIPMPMDTRVLLEERPAVEPDHDARELVGFVPWYFNMPDEGKDIAFANLLTEDGFRGKYGLTTAERRHPRFMFEHPHECLWNGPVWPFATSQVLVAVSNLLRYYNQSTITKDDYYEMLLQYARCHRHTKDDGTVVPWIDENLHPDTGIWLAHDILRRRGCPYEGGGGYNRGKDYNHSLFCDLVLSGLLGIDVDGGKFTADPMIPDSWNYFRVDNLWLEGRRYSIVYDKDGTHYGTGAGLFVRQE